MKKAILAAAALTALAVPAGAAEPASQQEKPAAQPGSSARPASRVKPVDQVKPVEQVKPVDQVQPVEANPRDTEFPETVDPTMGVPPLGQSREWREKIKERQEAHRRRAEEVDADKPDVLLDVPDVSVEEISFEINNLQAHLSLDAKVANLVKLTVGVDLGVDRVKLLIKGVHAEALLKVRLKHVAQIVDRALTTIDRNPQIVSQLLSTVEKTVTTVGEVAKMALAPNGLLAQTVNTLGQTVQQVVDTTGRIVERTLDTTGQLVSAKPIGDLSDMKLIKIRVKDGRTTRLVENPAGGVIEYVIDTTGTIIDLKTFPTREAADQAAQQKQDTGEQK